jgi:potassium efflux system protein
MGQYLRNQTWLAAAMMVFIIGAACTSVQGQADETTPALTRDEAVDTRSSGSPSSIDTQTGAVQNRLAEVRRLLSSLSANDTASLLSLGATPAEWAEQKRIQQTLEQIYQSHLDTLKKLEAARRYRQETKEKAETWHGFEKPGPYAVDFTDNLWDQLRTKEHEVEAMRKEQALFDHSLEDARLDFKRAEQEVRRASERLEASATDEKMRNAWLYKLGELRSRQEEARLVMLDTERDFHNELLSARIDEQTLLKHQALAASRVSPFTAADRDARLALLDRKQQENEAATQQAVEAGRVAQSHIQAFYVLLEKAQGSEEKQTPLPENTSDAPLFDLYKVEAESAGRILEIMRIRASMLPVRRELWEHRYAASHGQDTNNDPSMAEDFLRYQALATSWLDYLEAEQDIVRRRVDDQEQHLDAWKAEYGDHALAMRKKEALTRWEAVLRLALADAEDLDGELHDWRESALRPEETITFSEHLQNLRLAILKRSSEIWNFELVALEDKIVVDGREITGKRSVTLGKIIQALGMLLIGLWCTSRMGSWWRGYIMLRFSGKESAALLLHRLFSLAMGALVVVFSLLAVNIPLTVFAFVGGALAIAFGFGAQNILNNFISGLILLVERLVRLNDIVEVDGVRGRVTDIGARCCQIRCSDGIDMLIPNSTLLEKHVTNWTLSNRVRFTLTTDAAYGSPVSDVIGILRRAVAEHPQTLDDPATEVYLQGSNDSGLTFRVDYWVDIDIEPLWLRVASDLRIRIEELFEEAGIVNGFPQRDVRLDSEKPLKIALVNA